MSAYPLLDAIDVPSDLRQLPQARLTDVADEVRRYLIDTVSQCGGHFAAGLGAVELAVALHYVYDTPRDRLVWDVGHQAYPHKILTGRRGRLGTIRCKGGLAPFPARHESEFDVFGVGHSSTSLSAALGMAIASARTGEARRIAAVIGDGAMSAGIAFEAMNHIGSTDLDLLVVLNDNEMSISRAIGAFSNYLARLLSGKLYGSLREQGKKVLQGMPTALELARRSESMMKGMVLPGTIFEELGFNYVGPVDGHDIRALVRTLRNLRERKGPQFLHVVTKKGKGYAPAEADPIKWHGPGPFDPRTGTIHKHGTSGPTYSQIFGQWMCEMAERDPRLVAITPAMCEGSGLVEFAKRFPERYYDVGIAEQHAVTLAAGLACEGMHPVVAIYSTFLQRAYDQLIHDVALQRLPVVFAVDRAGFVGGDGATHQGNFDLSYLRCIPNLVIMAPADENECRQMLFTATDRAGASDHAGASGRAGATGRTGATGCTGPAVVRYPRGTGPGAKTNMPLASLPIGEAQVRRIGRQRIAVLAFGALVSHCEALAERNDLTLVNMRFIKPLDEQAVLAMARRHDALVTVEENVVAGGAGSAVNELLAAAGLKKFVLNRGIPDRFIEHGSREDCLAAAGLDAASLESTIIQWWNSKRAASRVRGAAPRQAATSR